MKRRLEEPVKTENSGGYPPGHLSPPRHTPRTLPAVSGGVQPTYVPQTIKPSPADLNIVPQFPVQAAFSASMPAVASTIKSSVAGGGLQGGAPHQPTTTLHPLHQSNRHKMHSGSTTPPSVGGSGSAQQQQFQRLKVEDALTYLDLVKMKFSNQPQVYNDFLDIMKEFKSQSIDTPGVIKRVSTLFGEHPDLIVGFNTFLPPGYKIEVRSNDSGFQVQVSMPSPSTSTTTMAPAVPPVHHTTVLPGATLALSSSGGTPTTVVVSSSTKPLIIGSTNVMGQNQPGPVPTAPIPVPVTAPPQPLSNALSSHYNHLNTITQVQTHPAVNHLESTSGSQSACVPAAAPPASTPTTGPAPGQPAPQNQPVEFNHAINYVNKIKNRFQGQPDKYKKFLEILHTYQKEQKNFKEAGKQLTEAEVYSQVAKLFENQDDLLAEFGQFLPDATNHQASVSNKCNEHPPLPRNKPSLGLKLSTSYTNSNSTPSPSSITSGPKFGTSGPHPHTGSAPGPGTISNQGSGGLKRSPSFTSVSIHHSPSHHHHPPPAKKHKVTTLSFRDVTPAEAGKYGSLNDYAFFDKVHRSLKNQEVYENFLRCIVLYNQEIVSRSELLALVSPFLFRHPELFRWFKDFVGESSSTPQSGGTTPPQQGSNPSLSDSIMNNNVTARQERPSGELAMDIDYSTCKRLGASYCALPKNYVQPRCSGRTPLCREVLNDTWVSFPTWSEDSTFVTSRKTQYEEYIYRCEDERFELDVVIETNAATIRVLEGVHKKLCRLSSEEVAKFRLDDCLGGNSPTIHQRALRRIYGDKAPDIIDGLKKNPVVAVPVVLRRLKAKEEEWREGQKGFNKIWKEQNEKFYLKSLDHQGINFKQNDLKALRSKSLFNEIETCYDERHEQADESDGITQSGPHLVLLYKDKSVLDDAANLLIHHVKRQTSIHKEDKQRTKQLLRQFIPDLFHHPRQELSEDEREDIDEKMDVDPNSPGSKDVNGLINNGTGGRSKGKDDSNSGKDDKRDTVEEKVPLHAVSSYPDECYTLFFGNNKWYLFLRYHQILCDRLTRMYERATLIARDESQFRGNRRESTAVALRLKPKSKYLTTIEVEDYYPAFLDMVKNVLDGNMEANTYEDTLREMFGIHAYIAFTLDKVVSYAVRQLQHLVSDESCTECVDMYLRESRRGGAGGPCITANQRANFEAAYQRKAEAALAEENCFKMFIYKRDCKLTIELLDTEGEDAEQVRETEKWSAYVDRYADPQNKETGLCLDGDDERGQWSKAVFLSRNVKKWRDKVGRRYEQMNDACSNSNQNLNQKSNDSLKIESYDDTQCRFNLRSYRMVFVVDKENYLYKRHALCKARQSHPSLSRRLAARFRKWHENWKSEHITQVQSDEASDWLMGRAPDTIANVTRVLTDNPIERPPYRSYNRYRVKRLEET
ncbi:paired amphipathic helix protein Sin3a-like isoform X2 [Lycorma delicatula]|uniref:paired amphipathic helix protein Sin3a-like isoform X2 n=1 Tax=Lycorma delicatula TaxID=130591 RepID=UPI003F51A0E0